MTSHRAVPYTPSIWQRTFSQIISSGQKIFLNSVTHFVSKLEAKSQHDALPENCKTEIENLEEVKNLPVTNDCKGGRISNAERCVIPIIICSVVFLSFFVLIYLCGDKIFTHTSSVNETTTPREIMKNTTEREKEFLVYKSVNLKWNAEIKTTHQFFSNLESRIQIKLKNVIDKYDLLKKQLEVLYSEVTVCGLNKCGNLTLVETSRGKKLGKFKCKLFKESKHLKKWASRSLMNFRCNVKSFEKIFQQLINFENSSLFHFKMKDTTNGSRLAVLNELKIELRSLQYDILDEFNTNDKQKHFCQNRINKGNREKLLGQSKFLTYLKLNEWNVIQQSNGCITSYRETLKKVLKCWRKREKIGKKYNKPTKKVTYNL